MPQPLSFRQLGRGCVTGRVVYIGGLMLDKPEAALSQHAEMRRRNEGAILSLLRKQDGLASSKVAKTTGLAPQTVSVLLRSLEERKLVRRGTTVKGKRGQPAVPLHLEPNGAFSLGIAMGWSHLCVVGVNLLCDVVFVERFEYDFKDVSNSTQNLIKTVNALILQKSGGCVHNTLAGVGLSKPKYVPQTTDRFAMPAHDCTYFNGHKFYEEICAGLNLPVLMIEKGQAACLAQTTCGASSPVAKSGYLFLADTVEGGLSLRRDSSSQFQTIAARLGSTLVRTATSGVKPLADLASRISLENHLVANGHKFEFGSPELWDLSSMSDAVDEWVEVAADALAIVIHNSTAIHGLSKTVLDGSLPLEVFEKLIVLTRQKAATMAGYSMQRPVISMGTLGRSAPAVGAALHVLEQRIFAE